MKKPALPSAVNREKFDAAVKSNIEIITGRRGKIETVATTATTAELAAKLNELLERLQA